MKDKIAIIGTGLVGGAWAIVFARAGHPVALFDSVAGAAQKARDLIATQLVALKDAALIDEAPDTVLGRITVAQSLKAALDGASYAQESAFERVDVKRVLFSAIDTVIGPDTIVGSSSSGIAASLFTDHVQCRARCLIAHPVNPPYLIPVVELVPAPWTAPESVTRTRALMESVGQAPVAMTREAEGFLINRLQGVLLMEAWRLLEAGLATAEDIDACVSEGLGLRWAFMGPFETIDLNAPGGIADYARRLGPLYQSIAASTAEHKVWDEPLIAQADAQRRAVLPLDQLKERAAWRDRRLMGLARHKREAQKKDSSNA